MVKDHRPQCKMDECGKDPAYIRYDEDVKQMDENSGQHGKLLYLTSSVKERSNFRTSSAASKMLNILLPELTKELN